MPTMSQRAFLYMLQKVDNQIDAIEDNLSIIEEKLNANEEIISSQNYLSELELQQDNKNKEIKKIEINSSQILSKIKTGEARLYGGTVKNPKELEDIQIEIASLKKRSAALEETLLELMIENEEMLKLIDSQKQNLNTLLSEKALLAKELHLEKEQLIKERARLIVEREPVINQINPDLVLKYEKLRKSKKRLAVTLIKDNACAACGSSLTPAEIQMIKSSLDEFYCKICKRMIYFG